YFTIDQAHLGLSVTATSLVEVTAAPQVAAAETPPWESVVQQLLEKHTAGVLDAYQFTFDSPGVKLFPELTEYAKVSFQENRPILEAVLELTTRINTEFKYDSRATNVNTEISE